MNSKKVKDKASKDKAKLTSKSVSKNKDKNKDKDRKLIVGYIKLILLFLVTIFLVLLLRTWYLEHTNYQLNKSIIREVINKEIRGSEIYNYIRENEDSIIYVGVVNDKDCRDFETVFKKIIKSKNMEDSITYLNLTNEENIHSFMKEFNKFYDAKLTNYPAVIIFEDGMVRNILIGNDLDEPRQAIINFFNNNEVFMKED